MNRQLLNRKTVIVGLIIVLVLGFLGVYGHRLNSQRDVIFKASPLDSVITVDGKKVDNNQRLSLGYGKHTATASLASFESITKTFSVTKQTNSGLPDQAQQVVFLLQPTNDGARLILLGDAQRLWRESLGGAAAEQNSNDITTKYPITKDLPYDGIKFKVGYKDGGTASDGTPVIILTISYLASDEAYKKWATDWLKFKGYDISKYKVEYSTFDVTSAGTTQ